MPCTLCGSDYHNRSACPMSGGLCDNSCMNTKFTCPKCDQDRDQSMRYRDRKHCVVCEGFRLHQRTENPSSFAEFESTFILKRDRKARGVKLCPRCDCEKPLTEFKPNGRCLPCYRGERVDMKRRHRARYAGEGFRPRAIKLHDSHVSEKRRHFYNQCKSLSDLIEVAVNRPWCGLSDSEAYRVQYRLDPEFRTRELLRRQVSKKAKRDGVAELIRGALRRDGKSPAVQSMFGYTIAELWAHLEAQFTAGMSRDAYMQGLIHIDHIIPQSAFDMQDDEQFRECWSLSNLRPLWARDNLTKSDMLPCGSRARTKSVRVLCGGGTQGGVLDAAPFDIWVT